MKRSLSLFSLTLALTLGVVLTIGAPHLASAQKKDDPVLARVNGVEIRQSDLDIAEADVGPSLQVAEPAARKEALLAYLIDLTALAQAASAKKLEAAPDFAARMAYAKNKVLMEALLSDVSKTASTEAEMKKLYDESVAKTQPEEEVRARHILLKTEAEANDVIAKLKGGADFEKLAREISTDPSAKTNGGDLEYFTKGQMVAEFSEAAFKLNKGQISAPVKTQFGFHVIKVEDKRKKPVPKYEEVKEQVQAFVVRKAQAELVMKTRADAKIENLLKKDAPTPPPAKADPKKK
ncbi:MAG: peptidylprolyl isomerase [Xanthobacteraceae bacterium]|jgi:peptidyl-prolyl cis-trans isomerase C|nr:peptidylprolyl isomerase [Xanthobacteraceae bacterium]